MWTISSSYYITLNKNGFYSGDSSISKFLNLLAYLFQARHFKGSDIGSAR